MSNSKKSGFTLVELSIVLVIIGLLIGGILAAQSMQDTARIQTQVKQIGQMDASVLGFYDRFSSLPGDASKFEVITSVGSGVQDNLIVESSDDSTYDEEAANFWANMSNSGFKREDGGGSYSNGYAVGTDYPHSRIGAKSAGVIVHGNEAPEVLDADTIANVYIIADCSAMTSTALDCSSGLSGTEYIALDNKLDDGVNSTGNVVGLDLANATTWSAILDGDESGTIAAGNTQDAAVAVIRIGLTHGSLK